MGIIVTVLSAIAILGCFISPVWATCAYTIINIVRPNEHYEGVLFPVIPVAIIAMGLAYFLHQAKRLPPLAEEKPKTLPLFIAMTVLLTLHLVLFRRDIMVSWILGEFAPVIFLLLYNVRHMSTPKRLRTYFTALMAGASAVAGQALFVHFLAKGAPVPAEDEWGDPFISYGKLWDSFHLDQKRLQGKLGGTFANSNDLGMVVNWAIPGAIFYLRRKGSIMLKGVGGGLMAMLSTTLLLTGSRGGLLQLGVTLWMLFVGGRRKFLGAVLLVVAVVGILVVLPRLQPEREDEDASAGQRMMLLRDSVVLFAWRPIIGVGYLRFPDFAHKSLSPHNVYAQALAETGIVGGALFFPLVFFLRREARKAQRYFEDKGDANTGWLAQCIAGLQFSFFVFLLFSNQFMRFTFALVMTPCVALYVAMLRDKQGVAVPGAAGVELIPEPVVDRDSVTAGGRRDLAGPVYPRAPRHARLAAAEQEALEHHGEPRQLESHPGAGGPGPVQPVDPSSPGGDASSNATVPRYVFDPEAPADGVQAIYGEDEAGEEGPDEDPPPPAARRRRRR